MHRDVDRYKKFSRRGLFLFGGNVALMSVLIGRMGYLQIFESEKYKTLAEDNRISLKLLSPLRGRILDRKGRPMAINKKNYRAMLLPAKLTSRDSVYSEIAKILGLDKQELSRLKRRVLRSSRFSPVVLKENLTWRQVASIEARAIELPGVLVEVGESRYYPDGKISGQIVGYVSSVSDKDNVKGPLKRLPGFKVGRAGVEKVYDAALRGKEGARQIEVNAFGQEIRELNRKVGDPGNEVWLTVDKELQRFTTNRLNSQSASAVVIDVHTGEVLALVSTPGFDPNVFSRGLSHEEWKKITSDPMFPLHNKAISGQYAPGSAFKMIVALAALKNKIISPRTKIYCNGEFELGEKLFYCWKKDGHGTMDLHNAISQSCDCYFYEVALKTGIDRIGAIAQDLGLGQLFDFELPGEKKGLIPSKIWKKKQGKLWHPGETLQAGIGQGFVLATPLQLAVMTARLVNGGKAIVPQITKTIRSSVDSNQLKAVKEAPIISSLNQAHLELIVKAMGAVTNSPLGTAYKTSSKLPGLAFGGKTGTVQVRRISEEERETGVLKNTELEWHERDHAIFVGFSPLTQPRYAVSVIVEHGGSGSAIAAPVARDILFEVKRRYIKRNMVAID